MVTEETITEISTSRTDKQNNGWRKVSDGVWEMDYPYSSIEEYFDETNIYEKVNTSKSDQKS